MTIEKCARKEAENIETICKILLSYRKVAKTSFFGRYYNKK